MHYVTIALVPFLAGLIAYAFFILKFRMSKDELKFYLLFLLAPVWALLTTVWSMFPKLSAMYGIHFLTMIVILYPLALLYNHFIKENFLNVFLPANIFVVAAGLLSLITGFPADAWDIGHRLSFAAIFTHQNVLASALMFTLPGVFALKGNTQDKVEIEAKIETEGEKKNKSHLWPLGYSLLKDKRQFLFFLLLALNLFFVILTYSRATMLAIGLGFLVYLILTKSYKTLLAGFSIVIFSGLLCLTNQSFGHSVDQLLSKHGGPILGARTILWHP